MNELQILLDQVQRNPVDDTLLLVYADRLQEAGHNTTHNKSGTQFATPLQRKTGRSR